MLGSRKILPGCSDARRSNFFGARFPFGCRRRRPQPVDRPRRSRTGGRNRSDGNRSGDALRKRPLIQYVVPFTSASPVNQCLVGLLRFDQLPRVGHPRDITVSRNVETNLRSRQGYSARELDIGKLDGLATLPVDGPETDSKCHRLLCNGAPCTAQFRCSLSS
jgi:hypothetical protein